MNSHTPSPEGKKRFAIALIPFVGAGFVLGLVLALLGIDQLAALLIAALYFLGALPGVLLAYYWDDQKHARVESD